MWKIPNRPNHEISQTYNDGVVTIYAVGDTAMPGKMPQETLTEKMKLNYEEQRLGINRYYTGMQNQIQIERVIRVQRRPDITNQDAAVTEDGKRYRINMVQTVPDVYPPSYDLTLAKVTHRQEVTS